MIRHSMLSLAAIGLLLVACGSSDREGSALSRPTGLAAPGMISELELILGTLEQRTMTQAATVCRASMAVAQRGSAKPGEEIASICRLALAAATGSEQTAMIAAQFASFDGELQFDLMLEAAAAGDASAYLALANQLEVQAGTSDAPYDALDANLLAAAHEAAARAVAGSISGADTVLRRLEDREFPFHGVEQEDLWRALYFRRFHEIDDTLLNRQRIAGMATAIDQLCSKWETSIRSVAFDTGLETYLAPVRAQVPGRMVKALPRISETVSDAFGGAVHGAGDRSFAGWLEHGMKAYQQVKRDVQNSVAVGSSVGRDAAQILFSRAESCRSRRGLHLIDSLGRLFDYSKDKQPMIEQASSLAASDPAEAAKPG
jgi:hypothetical protein